MLIVQEDFNCKQFLTFNEQLSDDSLPFFELTKFDGHRIKIDAEGVTEI